MGEQTPIRDLPGRVALAALATASAFVLCWAFAALFIMDLRAFQAGEGHGAIWIAAFWATCLPVSIFGALFSFVAVFAAPLVTWEMTRP
ncbi:MAG TPA: hypothetical protein VFA50_15080 [Stellaceae bacterium]|nr:hypothetical protein [Stellaceae bacterium]